MEVLGNVLLTLVLDFWSWTVGQGLALRYVLFMDEKPNQSGNLIVLFNIICCNPVIHFLFIIKTALNHNSQSNPTV